MGVRFKLARPTQRARDLRNTATGAEQLLWRQLKGSRLLGLKFSRQMPIAGYFCDFLCRSDKLVTELDGGQHVDAADYDAKRTNAIENAGYRVLRFWNNDLTTNMAGVLDAIATAARGTDRAPTPQPARGRGRREP